MTLDDCFDRQRELSIQHIEKMKKIEEEQNQEKLDKSKRAEAIFEKIKARSIEKGKKEDDVSNDNSKKEEEKMESPKKTEENRTKESKTPKKVTDVKTKESKTPKKVDKNKDSFYCEECEKTGTSFSSTLLNVYENHIITNHPNYKPFKCSKCSFTTHKRGNLNKHAKGCKGKET